MTDYNICLQTVAAVCSAVAAIAAAWVAKSTFTFQKNSLLKKASIEQIIQLLHQLHYLKSLTGQSVLGIADQEVTGLKQRISGIRESIMALESMISTYAGADVKRIRDIALHLREGNVFAHDENTPNVAISQQLDDAISTLQNIYRLEIK